MHRALRIVDILSMILDSCDTESLGRLTRVCRGIHLLAVARLWKSLESFDILLDTLPNDFVDRSLNLESGASRYSKPVPRPPAPHEWKAFAYYAQHVRHLSVYASGLSVEVYRALGLGKPGPYMLPNLTTLDLGFYPTTGRPLVDSTVFFSPSLINISLTMGSIADDLCSPFENFLATLASHSPRLTHFDITAPLSPHIVLNQLMDGLVAFGRLQSIMIFLLPGEHPFPLEEIMQRLAMFPLLGKLEIFAYHLSTPGSVTRPIYSSPYFPALRRLEIESPDAIGRFSEFLRKSGQLGLDHVTLSVLKQPSKTEMVEFLMALKESCALTLQHLIITHSNEYDGPPLEWSPSFLLGDHELQPLFSMESLVELNIDHHGVLAITDSFLEHASNSWPNIAILDLTPSLIPGRNPEDVWPLVTLRGVDILLSRCSNLQTLGLFFDDSITATNGIKREDRPTVSPIVEFEVTHSRINHTGHTAAWLSDMLLQPFQLTCWLFPDYDRRRMFNQTKALLPVFQNVRLEERERASLREATKAKELMLVHGMPPHA